MMNCTSPYHFYDKPPGTCLHSNFYTARWYNEMKYLGKWNEMCMKVYFIVTWDYFIIYFIFAWKYFIIAISFLPGTISLLLFHLYLGLFHYYFFIVTWDYFITAISLLPGTISFLPFTISLLLFHCCLGIFHSCLGLFHSYLGLFHYCYFIV